MNNRPSNKKGMLVLVLAAGLVFISIIFASISNRMRAEALITNRVSINERLNQFATAMGRLAIRKLQRDIELVDTEDGHGAKIVKIIVEDQQANTEIPLADYTSVINKMAVVQDIKKLFEEKYGSQGKIDTFKVEYKVNLGPAGFPVTVGKEDADGNIVDNGVVKNKFERRGFVDMVVTVGIPYGVTRKYTVRKDFVFARLLAAPFYRFTLFSPKGATIRADVANNCKLTDTGELETSNGKRPFICVNRRLTKNTQTQTATNYVANPDNVIKTSPGCANPADAFIKNGWIYLGAKGGTPEETDIDNNKRLILNVAPGSDDDDIEKKFGEYFHFYYDKSDAGWLIIDNWTNYFIPGDKLGFQDESNKDGQLLKVSMVNYGLYPKLLTQDMKFAEVPLFTKIEKNYQMYNSGAKTSLINNCSSMHLFGTPKHCTPTLIFGPVNRRYLRAFALFFPKLGRVFPLPSIESASEFETYFTSDYTSDSNNLPPFVKWYKQKVPNDYSDATIIGNYLSSIIRTDYATYFKGNTSLDPSLTNGFGPLIIDNEPYMKGLVNMSDPKNPLNTCIATNSFISNPEDLCELDSNNGGFVFKDEPAIASESLYTGSFDDIRINYDKFLKEATTYTIGCGANATEPIYLNNGEKGNNFLRKHFFTEHKGKTYFLLNQVIRIDGDLVIDEELTVAQGGIIIASGSITISAPIINKIIEEGLQSTDPNNFGFLTLIARKGIKIKGYPGSGGNGLPPKLEAFLISGLNKNDTAEYPIECDSAVRIIGGVAADKIDQLVEKGCMVEWGMDPGESTDYSKKDFYGITLGPRDIELYTAE